MSYSRIREGITPSGPFTSWTLSTNTEFLIASLRVMGVGNIRAQTESGKELTFPVRAVVNNIASEFRVMGERNVKITHNGEMTAYVFFLEGPLSGNVINQLL